MRCVSGWINLIKDRFIKLQWVISIHSFLHLVAIASIQSTAVAKASTLVMVGATYMLGASMFMVSATAWHLIVQS